jgi:hypothetical protein
LRIKEQETRQTLHEHDDDDDVDGDIQFVLHRKQAASPLRPVIGYSLRMYGEKNTDGFAVTLNSQTFTNFGQVTIFRRVGKTAKSGY